MKRDTAVEFVRIAYDTTKHTVVGELNLFITLILVLIVGISTFFFIRKKRKAAPINAMLIELELDIGGVKAKYSVERNYENLEIAHKLYIELITRKAAIALDEKHDLIIEIYDSWYILFKITREVIKNISGKSLQENKESDALITMATDILNKGLRPHLTEYQAKFRRWYNDALDKHKDKSPQQIQTDYPEMANLIDSMKKVNKLLMEYAGQLKKFVNKQNMPEAPEVKKKINKIKIR